MSRLFYAPPPLFTVVGGAGSSTGAVVQPQGYNNAAQDSRGLSSSSSSSIVIVIIVISSAIIVSATLYLLIRFLSRRFHLSFRTFSAVDDVVSPGLRCANDRNVASSNIFDSLPVFAFGSVTGKISAGDCAVCLSKFQSQDLLRLLPLCCHAFHAHCIDEWLATNQSCPLCRSNINATESDILNKTLQQSNAEDQSSSFRIEIGSVSRRRTGTASDSGDGRRSYSIGSFEYIVEDGYEVSVESTHRRGVSDCTSVDKESVVAPITAPAAESLGPEITGGRSWLRDYLDRFASISISSRTISFRNSGSFFTGSSRRSDVVVPVEDLESNRVGEEISELFRWFSGV